MSNKKPSRSLKTMLSAWFLFFSVVPLGCFTVYSILKYEKSIENELRLRGRSNIREFKSLIESFQIEFRVRSEKFVKNRELIYYMSVSDVSKSSRLVSQWMSDFAGSKISLIRDDGAFLFSAIRRSGEAPEITKQFGADTYKLSGDTLEKLQANKNNLFLLINSSAQLHLIHNKRVYRQGGQSVGFLEQVFTLSSKYISTFAQRVGAIVFVLDSNKNLLATSNNELSSKQVTELREKEDFFIGGSPHSVFLEKVHWGENFFYVGLGVSKAGVDRVIDEVTIGFVSAASIIISLLLVLIYFTTNFLLKPLNRLIEGIENLHEMNHLKELPISSSLEVNRLTESFNEMSKKVILARSERLEKIEELEKANINVRESQAQLVQAAKMASLGQLVAGVAHELNNPISYISSNMGFLREYTAKLHNIIDGGGEKTSDYEYMREDLTKLITSCEDGAERIKSIVLGLRKFSRLDQVKLKTVSLHELIESTLVILSSELKGRVAVHKVFGEIPEVQCFPSSMNQVFMNIIQNASQAIKSSGEIWIKTTLVTEDIICIEIKDSGEGMSEAVKEKVFEPFYTTKDVGDGTGLGMSISYGIVKKHGGEIRIDSELGVGSSFTIDLPVDCSDYVAGVSD